MDLALISGVTGLVAKAAAFVHDATVTDEGFIRAYYLEVSRISSAGGRTQGGMVYRSKN